MSGERAVQLDAARISCELSENGFIWRTPPSERSASVTIESSGMVFARVVLEPDGSRVTYRTDACRSVAPPA